MNACAKTVSWQEEVLLHDGSKIVVSRTQTRAGNHEIGQNPPVKEQTITFTLPGMNKPIRWEDKFTTDIGHANFNLLALHILNHVSYLIADHSGCLAYNKWGRPNPPYLLFKYDDNIWKPISLAELPEVFKSINLVINTSTHMEKLKNIISAEQVKKFNSSLKQPEYKTIIRAALPESDLCPDYSSPRYMSPKAPFPISDQHSK